MIHPAGLPPPPSRRPDAPVPERRIATLDILRGLALLGMVLAHCHKKLAGVPASLADNPIGWLITMAVSEKDRAIFALLFGASFAIMMRRIEARGLPVVPIFLRRLFVLYLIGFVVEACTRFVILREYAWWGVALLFLRLSPTRTLIAVAVLSTAAFSIRDLADSGYAIATKGLASTVALETARQQEWEQERQAVEDKLAGSGYAAAAATQIGLMAGDLISLQRLTPGSYLALFILGLLAVRHGIFTEPKRHLRLIVGMSIAGLACWAAARGLLAHVPPDFLTPRIAFRLRTGLGILDEQYLAFTYIGAVTLLLAYQPGREAIFAALGWVGRMALTNYILHAIVIDFIRAPYGLNVRLSPWGELMAAALLFGFLVLVSRLWLVRFRYGPVEWVWRSLTYWQLQPLRIVPARAG